MDEQPADATETRTARIWLRPDGIVCTAYRPNAEITLEDAEENVAALAAFCQDGKRPALEAVTVRRTRGVILVLAVVIMAGASTTLHLHHRRQSQRCMSDPRSSATRSNDPYTSSRNPSHQSRPQQLPGWFPTVPR